MGFRRLAVAVTAIAAATVAPPAAADDDLVGDADPRVVELAPRVLELTPRVVDIAPQRSGSEVVVGSDVLFAYDSAELMAPAEGVLASVVDALVSGPGGTVVIVGHTDSDGSDDYNLDLSRRRAESVRDHLVAQVGRADLTYQVEGRGESEPAATNDTPEGRQQNRRAVVSLPG